MLIVPIYNDTCSVLFAEEVPAVCQQQFAICERGMAAWNSLVFFQGQYVLGCAVFFFITLTLWV